MNPFVEQNHGIVDEGTGNTYGFHGYWAQDWTVLDPNFGTEADLEALVSAAHKHGIRIIMDVVVNHTGPVTDIDPVWPEDWVRTSPRCEYKGYKSTVMCTLVDNLPDILTESEADINLPPLLLKKWEEEGRLEEELAELDAFFEDTGYPRAPKYYIIKWLTDYVRKYGIDAYRLDTAKHTEEDVWSVLRKEADKAYAAWRAENPEVFPESDHFYMVGEVYNYNISGGRYFDIGDTLIDYFAEGIDHLINFEFKYDAGKGYEETFSKYASILQNELKGSGVVNYLSSHDDGAPYDPLRKKPFTSATKLILSPGACQIYYGDESSRILITEDAQGDANLRSFMNWSDIQQNESISGIKVQDVLSHYQKLGQFRQKHQALGSGHHEMLSSNPYIFKRSYESSEKRDIVVCGIDMPKGLKTISVKGVFPDGTELIDSYSGRQGIVEGGELSIDTDKTIVLLGTY
jgi:alpha-amylase